LTFDNIENQIVLRAATLLIPLISDYNEEIKGDLIHYSNLLKDEVSLVNVIPEDCERIQFGRLNDYYETIIQFSKAILQNYFIKSTRTGYSKGFNFIVNMNKVYEDFITALLINIVEEDEKFTDFIVETQERFHNLVRENKIITKPDLILKRKNTEERPFILDAKYKRQENNADYYQVIAYSLAIPTSRACFLIYPSDEEVEESVLTLDPKLLGNSDRAEIKLYAVKINLALDEEMGYKEYIGEIKGQLKRELLKSGYFGG
jgi:5-methylcytosine-specific restriction endonuclease McrBC regulatory subunit McrC